MPERKLIIEVGIDDDAVGSIEDLEPEILARDICEQAARTYLDSLQEDLAQQAKMRKGSKKSADQNAPFEFDFQTKRALDGRGKTFIVPYLHNQDKNLIDSIHYPSWKYLCTIVSFSEASFLIDILQEIKVSSSKLKKIFYENKTSPLRNPIYPQYNGQNIDVLPVERTISKGRTNKDQKRDKQDNL